MKILDCTLRDGGYYTNWDFDDALVTTYINAMNQLPIDYIELGYRNVPSNGYTGKFGYSPVSVLKQIRNNSKKKLAIMLNEKSTRPDDLSTLLLPIIGLVDMIRIAVDPINFERAVILATEIKKSLDDIKSIEGLEESNWVLVDSGDVLVSIFSEDARDYYQLDDFYGEV